MLESKQEIIKQMAQDPAQIAQAYLDSQERIQQLDRKIYELEHELRNPRGKT